MPRHPGAKRPVDQSKGTQISRRQAGTQARAENKVGQKHALKLRELRRIRVRFVIILAGMAAVTGMILAYLGIRLFVLRETIQYLDFFSLCFYGFASLAMTLAQVAFLRHLTAGAGRRIDELTYTDELTGLGNRRHMAKFLSEELREAQLSRNPLSVILVDLDDFKKINDTHGHKAGDLALRAGARALNRTVRQVDFVGRPGGDEFVLILPDTDSQCASLVAHRIAERLGSISLNPGSADARMINGFSASIGISSYPANANTREGLVEDADRTMYAAKNSGKGSIVISVARTAGAEPKVSAKHITTFVSSIGSIVDRTKENCSTQEQQHG